MKLSRRKMLAFTAGATLATAWPAWRLSHRWRRLIVLLGFPLSFLALVQGGLPACEFNCFA